MKLLFFTPAVALAAITLQSVTPALAQETLAPSGKTASSKIRRAPDGHPDLSGTWAFAIDLPPAVLTKVKDGQVSHTEFDRVARLPANDVPGAWPAAKAPSYKPEFQEKVKFLADNESKMDPVFYCGRPGVPRIGSPRKIVQTPNEVIFLYEDISGNTWRIIPTDGRGHRPRANPSAYGDGVGHWENDTLVVDTTNFVDDTWMGEYGYFHSDKMRVTERLWLTPENKLVYQATVDDPSVLTQPWTNFAHVIPPSTDVLEESPACKDDDGNRLLNLDHHLQR